MGLCLMVVFISQFSKVKILSPDILPVSTAMWDPKWFHNNCWKDSIFIDARGVLNGLRLEILSPKFIENEDCKYCKDMRGGCKFLKDYKDYIYSLSFEEIKSALLHFLSYYNKRAICLLVYEAPKNPCSERHVLKEWFEENGVEVKEL